MRGVVSVNWGSDSQWKDLNVKSYWDGERQLRSTQRQNDWCSGKFFVARKNKDFHEEHQRQYNEDATLDGMGGGVSRFGDFHHWDHDTHP